MVLKRTELTPVNGIESLSDFSSLSVPLKIVSSNEQKFSDVVLAYGRKDVSWVQFEPQEFQASKRCDQLRMLGKEYYPEIARDSALEKFQLIRASLSIEPGLTTMDSSLWQEALAGLPGLNAAQMYASVTLPDGKLRRSEAMLASACEVALRMRDRRVYWIETAVTAELGESGAIVPRVRQAMGVCFVPRNPAPTGSGMWSITCPHPVRLAEVRGDAAAVRHLQGIADQKVDLPEAAEKLGLLVPFANLSDEERVLSSPRGALFRRRAEVGGSFSE